jgi:hypothetical protein
VQVIDLTREVQPAMSLGTGAKVFVQKDLLNQIQPP